MLLALLAGTNKTPTIKGQCVLETPTILPSFIIIPPTSQVLWYTPTQAFPPNQIRRVQQHPTRKKLAKNHKKEDEKINKNKRIFHINGQLTDECPNIPNNMLPSMTEEKTHKHRRFCIHTNSMNATKKTQINQAVKNNQLLTFSQCSLKAGKNAFFARRFANKCSHALPHSNPLLLTNPLQVNLLHFKST